jgi:hypothetical protein
MTATGNTTATAATAGVDGDSVAVDPALTRLILDVLTRAAQAHHLHEVEIGGPHADWPPWYAQHMARTLTEAGYQITKVTSQ